MRNINKYDFQMGLAFGWGVGLLIGALITLAIVNWVNNYILKF